jgi:hypothetical protein
MQGACQRPRRPHGLIRREAASHGYQSPTGESVAYLPLSPTGLTRAICCTWREYRAGLVAFGVRQAGSIGNGGPGLPALAHGREQRVGVGRRRLEKPEAVFELHRLGPDHQIEEPSPASPAKTRSNAGPIAKTAAANAANRMANATAPCPGAPPGGRDNAAQTPPERSRERRHGQGDGHRGQRRLTRRSFTRRSPSAGVSRPSYPRSPSRA